MSLIFVFSLPHYFLVYSRKPDYYHITSNFLSSNNSRISRCTKKLINIHTKQIVPPPPIPHILLTTTSYITFLLVSWRHKISILHSLNSMTTLLFGSCIHIFHVMILTSMDNHFIHLGPTSKFPIAQHYILFSSVTLFPTPSRVPFLLFSIPFVFMFEVSYQYQNSFLLPHQTAVPKIPQY